MATTMCEIDGRRPAVASVRIRQNGEERTIAWRLSAVRDPAGGVRYFIGVGVDVTDQRRLEAQLQQAQKMEVLGTLVGGIAHDFNNHLTATLGNLQLVLGSPDLARGAAGAGDELTVLLRDAERAAQRGADMTQRLLTFSHARGFCGIPSTGQRSTAAANASPSASSARSKSPNSRTSVANTRRDSVR